MGKIDYWQKFEGNNYYHLYNRGINGTTIFTQSRNYDYFLHKWIQLIHPFCETMAYCLMPNHFHFLLQMKPVSNTDIRLVLQQRTAKSLLFAENKISYNDFLEDQFKRLFSSYALAFNRQENRTGSLFQKRFKRVAVKTESKLWHLLAYIHHNPIHHNYTENFKAWEYSSYTALIGIQSTFLSKTKVLKWFHEDHNLSVRGFEAYHLAFKKDYKMDYFESLPTPRLLNLQGLACENCLQGLGNVPPEV